jgi:transcriptional regulator with XRE-family HTH domain
MIPEIPINERLRTIREKLQLTQRYVAREIYIAQSAYARMETGLQIPNERIIELICYRFNVNREYLREGKDVPMFSDISPEHKSDMLYKIFEELNGLFQDYLIEQAKALLKVQDTQEAQDRKALREKMNM